MSEVPPGESVIGVHEPSSSPGAAAMVPERRWLRDPLPGEPGDPSTAEDTARVARVPARIVQQAVLRER